MKNFLIGMFAVTITASFVGCNNNTHHLAAPTLCNNCTLNGVAETTALSMIGAFKDNEGKDISSKAVSVWFNKDQLYSIDTLLQKEAKTKGTDGIRFYLACNAPATGVTKIDASIFMVSTRQRKSPPDPNGGGSSHIDYYDHNAAFLNSGQLGAAGNGANVPGAELYYPTGCISDDCAGPGVHYIDCVTSHTWVQNRLGIKDTINTYSEWFNLCWLHSLFQAIYNANSGKHLNGLRIYLALGQVPQDITKPRDIFLLAPTYDSAGTPTDYYKCLEDYTDLCDSAKIRPSLRSPKVPLAERKTHPFWMTAYDKGELCPNNCN